MVEEGVPLMCEYCDGSRKPIETEVDGEAYMKLTPDDYEYPEGFLLDVYDERRTDNDGSKLWLFSFIVPCCPMCGRELRGDA